MGGTVSRASASIVDRPAAGTGQSNSQRLWLGGKQELAECDQVGTPSPVASAGRLIYQIAGYGTTRCEQGQG